MLRDLLFKIIQTFFIQIFLHSGNNYRFYLKDKVWKFEFFIFVLIFDLDLFVNFFVNKIFR